MSNTTIKRWAFIGLFIVANAALVLYIRNRSSKPQADAAFERLRNEYSESSHSIVDASDSAAPLHLRAPLLRQEVGKAEKSVELMIHDGPDGEVLIELKHEEEMVDLDSVGSRATIERTSKSDRSMMKYPNGIIAKDLAVNVVVESRFRRDAMRREVLERQKRTVATVDVTAPEYTISLTTLPKKEVKVGDKWTETADVPADAPLNVRREPPQVDAEFVKRVTFDGRDAALIHAVARQHWGPPESSEVRATIGHSTEDYQRTRDEIRYYVDLNNGKILWYEIRSTTEFPEDAGFGTTIKRGQLVDG